MKRRDRGSAVIELALSCLIGVALMAGALFVGRVSLAARRAHALARHAAALAAVGVPAAILDGEIRDYAARLGTNAVWATGRYAGSAAAVFYRFMEASVSVDVPVAPLLGGGTRVITQRAVVEEDVP